MATTLSHAAPIAAYGAAAADRVRSVPKAGEPVADLGARDPSGPSRHQRVDALVTFAVMAWLTAALAWMVGELHGVPSAPATQSAATRDLPVAPPAAPAGTRESGHATMRLI